MATSKRRVSAASKRRSNSDLPSYEIDIDGEWSMKDFSEFFHHYIQVYSVCTLLVPHEGDTDVFFESVLSRYPWRGGYSVVNFYNDLDSRLGRRGRPRVLSIRYASPGAVEIAAIAAVAISIRHIVEEFVKAGDKLNGLYNRIRKGMIQRKLLSLEVREKKLQLSEREFEFARRSFNELSEALKLPDGEKLLEAAPDSITALKVLLSFFRRTRKLAEFEAHGKAKL